MADATPADTADQSPTPQFGARVALPAHASLDRIRDDARTLQRAVRVGDGEATDRVRRHHPKPDVALADPATFKLADAQLVLARRYGLSGWPALVRHLEVVRQASWSPGVVDTFDPWDQFCTLACLRYDGKDAPPRWSEAATLRSELSGSQPEGEHVWAAAAAADSATAARLLAERPDLANAEGGPNRWPPLMYLCYSRMPGQSEAEVLATARLLLDAGASPNAGFLWNGLVPPFTALTGVFGEGESGPGREPRHPHADALAELLLQAGADPNDGQTLYNRMFRPDNSHLAVLFAHGLGTGDGGPWGRRLGTATDSVTTMIHRQLGWAADHGFVDRLAMFAAHGWGDDVVLADGRTVADHLAAWRRSQRQRTSADTNRLVNGRTALHDAAWAGDITEIEELLAAGADPSIRDTEHHTTPLEWAEWAYQSEAADLLRGVAPND